LRKKCGQQDTNTAGGRWKRQHKTELDGVKGPVDYVSPGVTRHKSPMWRTKSTSRHSSQMTIYSTFYVLVYPLLATESFLLQPVICVTVFYRMSLLYCICY